MERYMKEILSRITCPRCGQLPRYETIDVVRNYRTYTQIKCRICKYIYHVEKSRFDDASYIHAYTYLFNEEYKNSDEVKKRITDIKTKYGA